MKPPRLADKFLKFFCAPHLLEDIQGDLHEEFSYQVKRIGVRRAWWFYWWEVTGFLKPRYIKRKPTQYPKIYLISPNMLLNYLKIAWRNLVAGKSFSFINIFGLAIGMSGTCLIVLWLQNEISFDNFHTNKDRIYQVYGLSGNVDGEAFAISVTSQPLGPTLKKDYPEVENVTRVKGISSFLVTANDKSITGIEGNIVDPSFFQVFSFPLVKGAENKQLDNLHSIVITEKLAKKLFGEEDALNKTIQIDVADNFIVTGILKDLPPNTDFSFEYLLPWDYLKKRGEGYNNESWLSNNTPTYVLLKSNTNVAAFEAKIKDISRRYAGRNDVWTHFLFPLSQWHLYSEFENGKSVGGRIEMVRTFGLIAAFILLIACINFMNLSTARSEKRAKEVGIRKAAGAGKGLLIGQFMMEAFLTASIAGIISLLIVQFALPSFNTLINTQLVIPYFNGAYWLWTLAFLVFTSLLAGSYPAFYLSSFNPIGIFKKQFKRTQAAVSPRKVLVVTQFTFAILLIISTMVVKNQVEYAQNREMGYSKNNLIHVNFVGDIEKNYSLIKQELLNSGIATSVTKTMDGITQNGSRTWGLRWPGEAPNDTNTTITLFSSDADFVKTANLKLIKGRDIDINKYPTDSFAVLLNETAVKLMGFKDPIGQILSTKDAKTKWQVVGVVKDYVTGSPYEEIPPIVIEGPGAWFNTMHIKLNSAHSTADNLAKAEQIFKKYNAAYPFDYQFVDQEYANQFENEQRTKTLSGLFAALAIFISCLGLFGLASFVAEQRTKEIGIRKVLGASVPNLWGMLSKDFLVLVLISLFIASPLAYYFMNGWLQQYSYRTEISWWIFAAAGVGALSITLLTVSFQAIKAALVNPVKSLKSE
jgi:ABC-type antimicrobial peptide transport system permease subunit